MKVSTKEINSYNYDYENILLNALARLKHKEPQHPDLIKKLKNGKLRINISTVCQEANCSRTLIGFKGCSYPKIREMVLNHNEITDLSKENSKEVIRRLRNDISELKDKIDQRDIAYAELLLRARALERSGLSSQKSNISKKESIASIAIIGKAQSDIT